MASGCHQNYNKVTLSCLSDGMILHAEGFIRSDCSSLISLALNIFFLFVTMQQLRRAFLSTFQCLQLRSNYHCTNLQDKPWHFSNLSTHPFEALKSSIISLSATSLAFSHNTGQLIRMFTTHICSLVFIFFSLIWICPTLAFILKYWGFL